MSLNTLSRESASMEITLTSRREKAGGPSATERPRHRIARQFRNSIPFPTASMLVAVQVTVPSTNVPVSAQAGCVLPLVPATVHCITRRVSAPDDPPLSRESTTRSPTAYALFAAQALYGGSGVPGEQSSNVRNLQLSRRNWGCSP